MNDYSEPKAHSSCLLDEDFDAKAQNFYDLFLEIIDSFSRKGYTHINIFIPITPSHNTITKYNHRLDNHFNMFNNVNVKEKLKKIFKNQDIKFQYYLATEEIYDKKNRIVIERYSGYIIECKWNKIYANDTCTIL